MPSCPSTSSKTTRIVMKDAQTAAAPRATKEIETQTSKCHPIEPASLERAARLEPEPRIMRPQRMRKNRTVHYDASTG